MKRIAASLALVGSSGCAAMHLGIASLNHPPELVGEWIDLRHTTPRDTSLWVLRSDGYDGTVHLREEPGAPAVTRTEKRYGAWYFQGAMNDSTNRELCIGRRIGRAPASCLKFDLDTVRDASGAHRRLTVLGYAGEHSTGDRQLIERAP